MKTVHSKEKEYVTLSRAAFLDLYNWIVKAFLESLTVNMTKAGKEVHTKEHILEWPDYRFYGAESKLFNDYKYDKDQCIKGAMEWELQNAQGTGDVVVAARWLRDYVVDCFNADHKEIMVKFEHFELYTNFIQIVLNKTINKEELGDGISDEEASGKIRGEHERGRDKVQQVPKEVPDQDNSFLEETFHPNILSFLEHENWHLYMYNYENDDQRRIFRLALNIHKLNQQYVFKLRTIEGRPPYEGKIILKTDRDITIQLVCELRNVPKAMFIMLSFGKNDAEIYVGSYLKKDNNSKIYAGSCILHKMPNANLNPAHLMIGTREIMEVPRSIRKFFSEKAYVFTKPVNKFDLTSLDDWIDSKLSKRELLKNHDLYLSAPVAALGAKIASFQGLNGEIKRLMDEKLAQTQQPALTLDMLQQLENSIMAAMSDVFFGTENLAHTKNSFNDEIIRFKEKFEMDGYDVYYSEIAEHQTEQDKLTPEDKFEREIKHLRQSRAFLMVTTFDGLFSSSWVKASYAMSLGMPVFLLYKGENSLLNDFRGGGGYPSHFKKIQIDSLNGLGKAYSMVIRSKQWNKMLADKNYQEG